MHTCTHLRKGGEIRAHRRNGRVETVARADSGRGVAQHTQHTRAASLPHGFRESQLTGVQEPPAPVCEVVSSMGAQTSAHPWMTRPNTPSPLHVGQDHPTHPALVRYQHMPDEQRAPLRLPSAVPLQVWGGCRAQSAAVAAGTSQHMDGAAGREQGSWLGAGQLQLASSCPRGLTLHVASLLCTWLYHGSSCTWPRRAAGGRNICPPEARVVCVVHHPINGMSISCSWSA